MIDLSPYPNLAVLVARVVEAWPKHETFVERSFEGRSGDVMEATEQLAGAVVSLAVTVEGGLATLCDDYRYMSEHIVLPEELYFRRHGEYRLKSFEDANRECYANTEMMTRYMNGLLVSNVIWDNHARAFSNFVHEFLPELGEGTRLLEVGPGHGFYLHFASQHPHVAALTAWDVSPVSVEATRHALDVLGTTKHVDLKVQNLFLAEEPAEDAQFDAIVLGEVLEHVEDPKAALQALARWLRPGGRIWINVPANSPAPDHIYLFRSVGDASTLVLDAGLELVHSHAFPMSGVTLEKAVKRQLAISCVLTAARPR